VSEKVVQGRLCVALGGKSENIDVMLHEKIKNEMIF
jgi:hypothetical protein